MRFLLAASSSTSGVTSSDCSLVARCSNLTSEWSFFLPMPDVVLSSSNECVSRSLSEYPSKAKGSRRSLGRAQNASGLLPALMVLGCPERFAHIFIEHGKLVVFDRGDSLHSLFDGLAHGEVLYAGACRLLGDSVHNASFCR